MTGIFISYRPEHTAALVGRLHEDLARHFGPEQVHRDVETLDPRDDFGQRIDEVVGSCDALVAVVSDHWLRDRNPAVKRPIGVARDWVQREIETAMRRPGVLVVPVLVGGATMPGELELPYSIRSLSMRHAMRLDDPAWDDDVERLIKVLKDVVKPRALPPGTGHAPAAATDAAPAADPPRSRWFKRR